MNKWKKKIRALAALLLAALAALFAPELLPQKDIGSGDFSVHFLDVGQADCALVQCDGETLLIDGGNREDGQFVVSYLEQLGITELDTVVCTHAHEDHVGGLPSVLAVYRTEQVLAPTRTYSSRIFDDFVYYVDQQGLEITIPNPGDSFRVGSAEVTVLGPVKSYADANNTSIVLKVDYGMTEFLFTGDMETEAETDMLNHWDNDALFQADVLKVGHHGSYSSTGYRLLNAVQPDYGVIQVGKGNDYGHPHKEPMERLQQAQVVVLRNDELGTIVAASDGQQVSFTWDKQNAAPEAVEPGEAISFIGNRNSKTLHSSQCGSLPAEKNRVEFASYQEAIDAGYTPCSGCLG